jgi:hypothetical protein
MTCLIVFEPTVPPLTASFLSTSPTPQILLCSFFHLHRTCRRGGPGDTILIRKTHIAPCFSQRSRRYGDQEDPTGRIRATLTPHLCDDLIVCHRYINGLSLSTFRHSATTAAHRNFPKILDKTHPAPVVRTR